MRYDRQIYSHWVRSTPFQENCKAGCPCESYECDDITTTQASTTTIATTAPPKEAVLLLSTYPSSNVPMVIDFKGKLTLALL